jgi:hypothetical protein
MKFGTYVVTGFLFLPTFFHGNTAQRVFYIFVKLHFFNIFDRTFNNFVTDAEKTRTFTNNSLITSINFILLFVYSCENNVPMYIKTKLRENG